MTDRQPVEVLDNGAIRYGVYNSDGTLNRYEYIKNEDGATVEGDALNKANLLTDVTAVACGLTATAVPDDVLAKLRTLIAGNTTLANTKAMIETGSYTGTGTYGLANKNSLTFSFLPKYIFIQKDPNYPDILFLIYNMLDATMYDPGTTAANIVVSGWDTKTISWYSVSDTFQMNTTATYHYIAIG